MSRKETKKQLIHLLDDSDNKVIALSGAWGIGKTHLWQREVSHEWQDKGTRSSIYASLFGVKSVDEVRLKLIEQATYHGYFPSVWRGSLSKGLRIGADTIGHLHTGFSELNKIPIIAAPAILRDRLIILDDIERSNDSLKTLDVLGFINELVEHCSCRVLLILNTAQLRDENEDFELLREKVIDEEIIMSTLPEEAIEIATQMAFVQGNVEQKLKDAIVRLGLNNIRIIAKIIKTYKAVLSRISDPTDAMICDLAPRIAIVSAVHYRAWGTRVTTKTIESETYLPLAANLAEVSGAETEEQTEWKRLMQQIGIYTFNGIEPTLAHFVKSGHYDDQDLTKVLASYTTSERKAEEENFWNDFLRNARINPLVSHEQLVKQAKMHSDSVGVLGPGMLTAIFKCVSKLANGENVARTLLNNWLGSADLNSLAARDRIGPPAFEPYLPEIDSALRESTEAEFSRATVIDATTHIRESHGWSSKEEAVLNRATKNEIKEAIFHANATEFEVLMYQMIEFVERPSGYGGVFTTAGKRFEEACAEIVRDNLKPRYVEIIQWLFKSRGLGGSLHSA